MVEAALQGCGLAYVWDNRVMQHLASGALVRCLDDWCVPDDGLFLYYPSRRYLSAGLRALIDMLRAYRHARQPLAGANGARIAISIEMEPESLLFLL